MTIVGDGTLKKTRLNLIEKKGLQASTELVGACGGLEPFLAQADIFVHPAVKPGRTDELLAAMASKLPAVALETAATRALITHGVSGVLAADEAAFVAALDKLMVDWGYRVGLAVAATKVQQQRPLDAFIRTVWEIL